MPEFDIDNFTASSEHDGQRLDKALSTHPLIRTRSRAAKLIQLGRVTKNGNSVKVSQLVANGDTFVLHIPTEPSSTLEPYDLSLDVIFEDEDLIVINKPSGLVVHPSHGHENKTLVNALLHHCDSLSMGFAERRPGIVHRLDKDTSGLMVAAKNDLTHSSLADQFKNKSVIRRYKALCYGYPKTMTNRTESFLIRHPKDRKKYCSEQITEPDQQARGKWSATNFELVADYKEHLSLIYCRLETGRTHQIRVHLSELGLPIINDPIYLKSGRKKSLKSKQLAKEIEAVKRLGLHAFELGFIHPRTKEKLYFKLDWPNDLTDFINTLGFKNP